MSTATCPHCGFTAHKVCSDDGKHWKYVCEAVAKIYLFLCQRVNVPCAIKTGTLNGTPHAWNMVEVNGSVKYVDVTAVLQTIPVYTLLPAVFFRSEQSLRSLGYNW